MSCSANALASRCSLKGGSCKTVQLRATAANNVTKDNKFIFWGIDCIDKQKSAYFLFILYSADLSFWRCNRCLFSALQNMSTNCVFNLFSACRTVISRLNLARANAFGFNASSLSIIIEHVNPVLSTSSAVWQSCTVFLYNTFIMHWNFDRSVRHRNYCTQLL